MTSSVKIHYEIRVLRKEDGSGLYPSSAVRAARLPGVAGPLAR
jgi:hypothetical protein